MSNQLVNIRRFCVMSAIGTALLAGCGSVSSNDLSTSGSPLTAASTPLANTSLPQATDAPLSPLPPGTATMTATGELSGPATINASDFADCFQKDYGVNEYTLALSGSFGSVDVTLNVDLERKADGVYDMAPHKLDDLGNHTGAVLTNNVNQAGGWESVSGTVTIFNNTKSGHLEVKLGPNPHEPKQIETLTAEWTCR